MPVSRTEVRQTNSSVLARRWIATPVALTQLASQPVIARVFGGRR
jgi:hypothetical protein